MTSGVQTFGVGHYGSISTAGWGAKRTWSGADGKYTASGRLKWNNYSVTAGYRSTIEPKCRYLSWNSSPSPGHWETGSQSGTPGFGGTQPAISSNQILKMQARLAEKVKGHDWNLAVDASQLRQTSGMVVGALKTLTKAALAISHGDVISAARAFSVDPSRKLLKARNVGSRWLELQYGWKPTLQSVHEAAKAYHALTKNERKRNFTVSTKASRQNLTGSGLTRCKHNLVKTMYIQCEVYEDLSAPRSLGLVDPLSVLWENVPFSFVVDWFIPIGTYIANLNAIPAIKGRFLTTTVVRDYGFSDWEFLGTVHSPLVTGDKVLLSFPSIEGKETVMDRVSSTNLFVPKPSFNVSGAVHGTRIANAIALSGPIFRKIFGN